LRKQRFDFLRPHDRGCDTFKAQKWNITRWRLAHDGVLFSGGGDADDFLYSQGFADCVEKSLESLSAQGHVVITNNGKPTALMIDIADNNLEEVLAAVRQAQATRAMNRLQADSLRKGLDGLTEDDIEAEIAAARKERKRKIDVAGGR